MVSTTPGRLRIKYRHARNNPSLLNRIKGGLEARSGVSQVRVNPVTGSFVVHYDPARCDKAGIFRCLQDIDVIVEDLTHGPSVIPPQTTLTANEAIRDLNTRLSRWTGLPIDLRTVLPLAFVGAGLWSLIRNGLMIEKVPAWLLFWLGFDLFVKARPQEPALSAQELTSTRRTRHHSDPP
jgi:copper chaperone CopZ